MVESSDYVEATVRESLRSRPVLPNVAPRLVKHPVELGGWPLSGGCLPGRRSAYLIHHDAAIYPDPYSFLT